MARSNRTRARIAAAALAALASGCVAHFPRSDEPIELMERTTIAASNDPKQEFEVNGALHVMFANGFDHPGMFTNGGRGLTLSFSFMAIVRVESGPSAPVAPPNFEPRFKLQLFDVSRLGDRPAWRPAPLRLSILQLVVGHRSNGQQGCSLADHVRAPGEEDFSCDPLTQPPNTALNLKDGSFTTNYVGGSAYLRYLSAPDEPGPALAALTGGVGLEWEFPCNVGCMSSGLRARHGPFLLPWQLEYEVLMLQGVEREIFGQSFRLDSTLRGTLAGTVHLGADRGPFGDLAAEIAVVPRHRKGIGLGLFIRRHVGYDYLNLRFEQRLDEWIFGAVLDPNNWEWIGERPVEPPYER